MYAAEKGTQPAEFGSILRTFYYTIVTMTTIGYGDVTPKTYLGKLVFSCFSMIPIMVFAIPTSIIGAGFIEEITKQQKEAEDKEIRENSKKKPEIIGLDSVRVCFECPHCKKEINKSLHLQLEN